METKRISQFENLYQNVGAFSNESALCLRAAVLKPVREMSCKICEKMLHTLFKAESSSDSLVFANSTYQRLSAFVFPAALSTAELIWTRMISLLSFIVAAVD